MTALSRLALLSGICSLLCVAGVVSAQTVMRKTAADAMTEVKSVDGKYISWREHRIDDSDLAGFRLGGADGLAITDLDRDGFPEVISVHEDSAHVRIAFGTDDPDRWISFTLAEGTDLVGKVEDVALGDLNGDDRTDIVVACEEEGHIVYFECPEMPREMKAWKPVILEATRGRGSWIWVDIADLDGDGKPEILAANKGGTTFSYFKLDGKSSDPSAWLESVLGETNVPIHIRAVDIDQDGDMDVFGGSRGEGNLVLFENLGGAAAWRTHAIYNKSSGNKLQVVDLNGDRRLDILFFGAVGKKGKKGYASVLQCLKQPDDLSSPWIAHELGRVEADVVAGKQLVDINGDGRLDLFVGGYSTWGLKKDPETIDDSEIDAACGRLAWFEQPAEPLQTWPLHTVSRRRRGMFDMFVPFDVNRDRYVDLVTTRGESGRGKDSSFDGVVWLEQVRTTQPRRNFTPARVGDSPEIPLPLRLQ